MEQVERRGAHVRAVADRGARFAGEGAARERPAAAALLQRAVLGADEDRGRRVEDLAGDDALDWRVGQVPPARGAALRVVDDHLVWVSPSRQARTGRAGLLAPRVPLLCRLRLRLLACCGERHRLAAPSALGPPVRDHITDVVGAELGAALVAEDR